MGKSTVSFWSRPWSRWIFPWTNRYPSGDQLIDLLLSNHERREANIRFSNARFDAAWQTPDARSIYMGRYWYGEEFEYEYQVRQVYRKMFEKFWTEEV